MFEESLLDSINRRKRRKVVTSVLLQMASFGLGLLLRAWVVHVLWAWFIVPFGVPALSLAHAVGLCLLIMLYRNHQFDAEQQTELGQAWLIELTASGLALLFGWLAMSFMVAS